MIKPKLIIAGVLLLTIGVGFGVWFTTQHYAPRLLVTEVALQEAQVQIDLLEADKSSLNKFIRFREASHLNTINSYRVTVNRYERAIKRLEGLQPEWEFYTGVYTGCVRIFVIGNPGFSPDQVIAICNAFTKEHYGLDMYHWDEPPGIDKDYIQSRPKGEGS